MKMIASQNRDACTSVWSNLTFVGGRHATQARHRKALLDSRVIVSRKPKHPGVRYLEQKKESKPFVRLC